MGGIGRVQAAPGLGAFVGGAALFAGATYGMMQLEKAMQGDGQPRQQPPVTPQQTQQQQAAASGGNAAWARLLQQRGQLK